MPGYIHTCGNCGAHMQVHERYLGRTLRCTSCRTEFEAALPEGAVAEGPGPPPVEIEAPKRSATRFLPWLLLLIPLAGAVWWLGQPKEEGAAAGLFRDEHAVGEIASVDTGSGRPVMASLDYEGVGPLVTLQQGAVQINVGSLMDSDRYIELPAATEIRILGYADKGAAARIRILKGPWESRIVWIPTRWIR
jgi:hypothetical protein